MSAPFTITASATIGTSLTTIATIPLNGQGGDFDLQLDNTGATPLAHFQINKQFYANGPWIPWLADTDFAATDGEAIKEVSSTSPQTLPAGQTSWFKLNFGAAYAVQLQASVTTSSTTLNLNGSGKLSGEPL